MKLTRQCIAKLMDPVNRTSRIVNDAYRECTATAKFNSYKIELRVAVIHPLLQDKCPLFRGERVTLMQWIQRDGKRLDDIPEELEAVIDDLRQCATMDRQEALGLCIGMKSYFGENPKLPVQKPETSNVVQIQPESVLAAQLAAVDGEALMEDDQTEVTTTGVEEIRPELVMTDQTEVLKPEGFQAPVTMTERVHLSRVQRRILADLKAGHEIPQKNYHSLEIMKEKGVIDGIEMTHPMFNPETRKTTGFFTARVVH